MAAPIPGEIWVAYASRHYFISDENVAGYIQDQYCYPQADGAP